MGAFRFSQADPFGHKFVCTFVMISTKRTEAISMFDPAARDAGFCQMGPKGAKTVNPSWL
ncbi:MAG: hypothetical protein CMJ81_01670 [Planctomycetaceae bacterium]|nr:hypothetical protein [Planctomycetaceae bacterium]MBP63793.1 hypothetical protein [Planctomycetaceae bacterium]